MLNSIRLSIINHAEPSRQPLPGTENTDYELDFKIPMRDGHENSARLFKPASPVSDRATVVIIHGGGFTVGHPTHVSHYARAVARLFGTTVLCITYRLAPEFKFPTAPNDVWDSLEWIFSADNSSAAALGSYNKAKFIIGGVSAGANLSAVTAQKWISAKRAPNLVGVWLSIPWLLEPEILPEKYADVWLSRDQNAKALVVDQETLDVVKAFYQPDVSSTDFSPFNDRNAHKGLSPVYLQVCGQDPLRDDGIIYEKVLGDNGVPTKIDTYQGVPHGFADVLPTFPLAQKYIADTMKGFGWLFGVETSDSEIAQAFAPA
ncbi:alpha beta hydrolase fold-3 domain-containing protein [Colletotrichum truncatum]|uniref:Alpha beta hydrolase fold-3 domain-containing protein n=1 Tax=Colletotrichum truncatum TaxID=5467 RepID=A0ACC3YPG3_COLTU|nr:alpha beta hydrolase fold-3 domain-containing protein [Colletotrichum truncatum]KAF6781130.1 alpha beta hydrolase fold-3 domain-containing protein [Colletotrichum truncatum]